jgi:putative flippase GtrA
MKPIKELWQDNREKILEIVRFGITGIVSTLVTYAVYYVCLLWLNPTLSFSIGYIVAMIVNYILTTSFTFKVKANKKNAAGFVISNGINYALCTLFLNFFIWIGVSKKLAPIPMYAICIPVNFLIVKFVMKHGEKN